MTYFTHRNFGLPARTVTELNKTVRDGIINLLQGRANDAWFGMEYPDQCPDGRGTTGTNLHALRAALGLHRLFNFVDGGEPSTHEVLDLIEFAYEKIAEPRPRDLHDFFGHYHFVFAQVEGRAIFREEINQVFERNGIAFQLMDNGQVERIAPEGLREPLTQAVFHTEDDLLNQLLERARTRFLSRDPAVRKESLETLWDAWERLKSLAGPDKKASVAALLDGASGEPNFRAVLETEARSLTDIGNKFMIRHSELAKIPIADGEHIDFLFHRLFAVIRLLLRKSNRGG